ncbi:prolipoprotein diacylglyceryl transferase [Gordonia lacunae]|uniref:prolipoprotein diacylglyceryl transferase n=1 Tax=Gordonia lacunae TaxID=417102 RepID=UPI0039E5CC1B
MIAPTSTMLAYLPSPPQGVWDIGPFPLRAYALCIIVGIIVAVWWGNRRWMARGGQDGEVLDVAIWAVPFGLIGGRLYHVITDWKTYFGADALKEPIDTLKIWDGGLGIWGAVALGAVGAWIGARRRGIRLPAFGDAIAPPILLAQAIGRVGNYFNQELYGRETTLPWGLEIYERQNAAGYSDPGLIDGVSNGVVVAVVHPTFLYELLWNVLIVVLLVVVDRYFRIGHGRLFALYVAGYCLGRFFVELLRDDRAAVANDIAGIRPNLFTAALVFLAAIIYFVVAPKGREQGLEMYHDDRAAELAEQGVAGYVDDWYDEDAEPETSSVAADGVATGTAGSSLFDTDDPGRTSGEAGEPSTDDTAGTDDSVTAATTVAAGSDAEVGVEPETDSATESEPVADGPVEPGEGAVETGVEDPVEEPADQAIDEAESDTTSDPGTPTEEGVAPADNRGADEETTSVSETEAPPETATSPADEPGAAETVDSVVSEADHDTNADVTDADDTDAVEKSADESTTDSVPDAAPDADAVTDDADPTEESDTDTDTDTDTTPGAGAGSSDGDKS